MRADGHSEKMQAASGTHIAGNADMLQIEKSPPHPPTHHPPTHPPTDLVMLMHVPPLPDMPFRMSCPNMRTNRRIVSCNGGACL
jgi:hypothetical protein